MLNPVNETITNTKEAFELQEEKPSLEELAHHGVAGMKWGHRNGKTGVRPVAQALNDSKVGRAATGNVERHLARKAARTAANGGPSKSKQRANEIRSARKNVKADRVAYKSQASIVNATAKGSEARVKGEKELAKMKTTMLKNPDRVTAVKLTRGEKAVSIIGLQEGGLGIILASTIASHHIAKKQKQGGYDLP